MFTQTALYNTVALPPLLSHASIDTDTGASLEYWNLMVGSKEEDWIGNTSNEIGLLVQGVLPHMPYVTDTVFFIKQK